MLPYSLLIEALMLLLQLYMDTPMSHCSTTLSTFRNKAKASILTSSKEIYLSNLDIGIYLMR